MSQTQSAQEIAESSTQIDASPICHKLENQGVPYQFLCFQRPNLPECIGSFIQKEPLFAIIPNFITGNQISHHSCGRKAIDRDQNRYLVVRPQIIVCPVDEFFIDPGQENDRAVSESVCNCLLLVRYYQSS